MSIVIYSQSDDIALKYLQHTVNITKQLQNRLTGTYLACAWSRLCLKFPSCGGFTELGDIFPKILEDILELVKAGEDELNSSVQAIVNTIDAWGIGVRPFAKVIVGFVK